MKKSDKLKKKQRKRYIRESTMCKWEKADRLDFRCMECEKKMNIVDDYHWAYGFCSQGCGMRLYGVG